MVMGMSDAEKIRLIRKVIIDFWRHNSVAQMKQGAVAVVVAIHTIAAFEDGEERKDNG